MIQNLVERCLVVSSSVSLCGAWFTIMSFILFEESRRYGRRLLLRMSIADLGTSISWLMSSTIESSNETSFTCCAQAYMLQFFRLSSYLGTSCFAFHLYQIIYKGNKSPHVYERWYSLIIVGAPLVSVLSLALLHMNGYNVIGGGYNGQPWCWIRAFDPAEQQPPAVGVILQLLLYYVPVTLSFSFNLALYTFLLQRLGEVMSSRMESKIRLRIVFFITFSWSFAGVIYQIGSPPATPPQHTLLLLSSIFGPLAGALNTIAYGFNSTMKERYSALIHHKANNPKLTYQ